MNKKDAKIIAKTITFDQVFKMLDNAQKGVTNWRETSSINFGITKGMAWNLLAKPYKLNNDVSDMGLYYLILEFGDYLPEELKIKKIKKINNIAPIHQDPIFD